MVPQASGSVQPGGGASVVPQASGSVQLGGGASVPVASNQTVPVLGTTVAVAPSSQPAASPAAPQPGQVKRKGVSKQYAVYFWYFCFFLFVADREEKMFFLSLIAHKTVTWHYIYKTYDTRKKQTYSKLTTVTKRTI